MSTARRAAGMALVAFLVVRALLSLASNVGSGDWPGVAFAVCWLVFLGWVVAGFCSAEQWRAFLARRKAATRST